MSPASGARLRALGSLVVALLIGGAVLLWVHSLGGPEQVHARFGLLAPAVTLAAHTAAETMPGSDLVPMPWAMVNGALYGWLPGGILSLIGWLGASAIQYTIARRIVRSAGSAGPVAPVGPRWLARFPVGHPLFLIGAQWVPLGRATAAIAAGASGVAFLRLLGWSALGGLVPALVLAATGAGVLRLL